MSVQGYSSDSFSQFKPVYILAVMFVPVLVYAQPRDECDQGPGLTENWFDSLSPTPQLFAGSLL